MNPYLLQIARENQAKMRREAENLRTQRKSKMDSPSATGRMLAISTTLVIITVALVRFIG